MATALITHAECLEHVTPNGHPERVARLEHVLHALEGLDLRRETAPLVDPAHLAYVHPQAHVDAIVAAQPAIRPPGHHAETSTPMGFCLFGNAAIGAKHALEAHGLSRVAVVDFDVHHGNGTQHLLWNEARALTITTQQMPLWPGTGDPSERGAHDNVLNVPLAPRSGGAEMRAAYEAQVFPRLRAFKPELIILSAGFDAHQDDPLAELQWSTEDFRWLTRQLCALAADLCEGRIVSTLEGGYDLSALAESARAHVEELMEAAS
jgi:acetoin utilization deacetylase AcuC-like enzyme